jgi:hypothetical protein
MSRRLSLALLLALFGLTATLILAGSPAVLADEPTPSTEDDFDAIPPPDDNGPLDLYEYHVRHALAPLEDPRTAPLHRANIIADMGWALAVRPNDAKAWRELGRLGVGYIRSMARQYGGGGGIPNAGDYARLVLYAAVDRDPTDAEAWILLSESYYNEGRTPAALIAARDGVNAVKKASKTGVAVDQLIALEEILAMNEDAVIEAEILLMRDLKEVTPSVFMAAYFSGAKRGGGFTQCRRCSRAGPLRAFRQTERHGGR